MIDNLVDQSGMFNTNSQSQQSLQWLPWNKHQSEYGKVQARKARQAIPSCSCPIIG